MPGWYDPVIELFHFVFDEKGSVTSYGQLTETDPHRAHWLPAIEHYDWLRPDIVGAGGHWYLYTSGINAGLISQTDYNDALQNDVYLSRL